MADDAAMMGPSQDELGRLRERCAVLEERARATATVTPLPVAIFAPPATAILEPTGPVMPTPTPGPTAPAVREVDAGGRGARVRDEPSLGAAILGVLPERARVSLLGPEVDEEGRA